MPLTDSTSPIPDLIIDKCHEAYIEEVNSWRIVGPLRCGPTEMYRVVRDRLFSTGQIPYDIPVAKTETVQFLDFSTEAYAIDFLRWRGTKAAVEAYHHQLTADGRLTPEDVPPPPTDDAAKPS